ncbi:MAG: hypothetical protein M3O46_13715 [Myxococcota bacterium]|nr:hypothetical protein [Myxococcota bacterium]
MAAARDKTSIASLAVVLGACVVHSPCDGVACAASCPRDSVRDASGRCACIAGELLVLGACVPPAVADAYCGPLARFGVGGCVFRGCPDGSILDVANGACLAEATVGTASCGQGMVPIVALAHTACVSADAACPRGTRRTGTVCDRPPSCPPGTLVMGRSCRSVVSVGMRADLPRVDVGAWVALVLGADGGPGTRDLCRPLELRPDLFDAPQGTPPTVNLGIAVISPDQDLTRVHANVYELRVDGAGEAHSADIESLIGRSVSTLIEPLRGLGGESSTAVLEVAVSCKLGRP